jgi:hypothetical protein
MNTKSVVFCVTMLGSWCGYACFTVTLKTGDLPLQCTVRPLSAHEIEALFFTDEAMSYTKKLATFGLFCSGESAFAGAALATSQALNYQNMKVFKELFEPVQVVIHNKSDAPITVTRNQYITAYAKAAVLSEDLIHLYPNFKKHVASSAICTGVLGVTTSVLTVFGIHACLSDKMELGGMSLFAAVLFAIPLLFSSYFTTRAVKLRSKYNKLKSLAPMLKKQNGISAPLLQAATYTIPPYATFTDVLVIYKPALAPDVTSVLDTVP